MHPFTWDIDRVLLYIPYLDFPIYWYGFLFALGLFLSQKWLIKDLTKKNLIFAKDAQNLIFILIISIVVGARIGDVLFYQDLKMIFEDPIEVVNLRAGGLSSHGGFLGFLLGLFLASKRIGISFVSLLSSMAAPAGLLAFFIRIGNFFNQEILGTLYSGRFSVVFSAPLDGSVPTPRHPVVIYEAISYLLIAILLAQFKVSDRKRVGLAMMLYFGARLLLEQFKEEQSIHVMPHGITMGMILSMPIVIAGVFLFFKNQDKQYRISQ